MTQNYELVIFDVDGTILDTTEGVLSSVKHTISTFGLQMLSDEQLAHFIGPPIQNSFQKAYGLEGEILQELANVFRKQYKERDLLKAAPYDGIYEVFERLSRAGIISAIATYKREDYARILLKHYGFDKYTSMMYGADHYNRLKKSDIINRCISESGVQDRKKMVMIGDTDNDAVGAEQIGIDFIAVTYGFGFRTADDLKGLKYTACLDNPKDLIDFLNI